MNKPVFYILFFLIPLFAIGQQNLVPNASFEEFSSCPQSIGEVKCYPWFSATITTPDFYTPCGTGLSGTPINAYGNQNAFDGNSYVGINLNADDGYREYIAVKLIEPLQPLKKYVLKFYVSNSDLTKYPSNNLGAYFIVDTLGIPLQIMTGGTPAIISSTNIVFSSILISDEINWVEMSYEYLASGCEEFLIIGNFLPQDQTTFGQNSGLGIDSYYYIDEVSLVELSSIDLPNIFTPNADGINDFFEIENTEAKHTEILNRWGNIVYESNDLIKWNGGNQPDGVYYYKIDFGCGSLPNIKTGFVQLIR
ncbi:T9SS C-terminal target domain-containing protein [Fluviicola taffensis]|uniref:Gliding motility-associated C-terminal domain-containing protein n=1 Tax=Fluviicola taffensis (strain DSM 16823 / NCIMB 13979 / RW262) TaxID=755732 RepID=F2IGP3_FLUTR|nr:T9SS C-terminal target domain-containing protein [Fluviicola taffensis]AEA43660.1 hypothetical protein Fluta_1668 [Fluviicola taffensis DSM 16823]